MNSAATDAVKETQRKVLVMRATVPLIGAMQQPYATGDSIFTRPPGSDRLLEILFNS